MQFSKRLWTVVLPQINCLSKLHFWWQQMFWKMAFCSTFKPRFFPPPQKSAKECIILRKKRCSLLLINCPSSVFCVFFPYIDYYYKSLSQKIQRLRRNTKINSHIVLRIHHIARCFWNYFQDYSKYDDAVSQMCIEKN